MSNKENIVTCILLFNVTLAPFELFKVIKQIITAIAIEEKSRDRTEFLI